MYRLRLTCPAELAELVSAELWEAGTAGIEERDASDSVTLIARFERNELREELLKRFRVHAPEWQDEGGIDWTERVRLAWPGRSVGNRLWLAPAWNEDATPLGRERIIHNPGLACGTGEHACTQLALLALEKRVTRSSRVVDVGTGSGILAIAALRLGAYRAVGLDVDEAALPVARGNFLLNGLAPELVAGSADAMAAACSDVTVANISATMLLAILDDLIRITRGWLILTGFPDAEARRIHEFLPGAEVSSLEGWRCLTARLS